MPGHLSTAHPSDSAAGQVLPPVEPVCRLLTHCTAACRIIAFNDQAIITLSVLTVR